MTAPRSHGIDQMVETFITELEQAVDAMVKSRLRDVIQSVQMGDGSPGRTKGQVVAELRAAVGLPAPLSSAGPAVISAGRVVGESTRARPGRCVGVITGGRRCGRAAPPGDPPLCSFCRATLALKNGGTARVSITVSPPEPGAPRLEPIQISAPTDTIVPAAFAASRKERCKGVLLGGGSCRSRVMPPNELCPWCRALGVRSVEHESEAPAATTTSH
jgi:hypothetical protein